jgi:hypothetical protein
MLMNDLQTPTALSRREMLARMVGGALAFAGLTGFRRMGTRPPAAPKWDDRFELAVDVVIAAQQGSRYHRPYVAVWVEDAAGQSVRTLILWVNTGGRGQRYIRELRRWFAADRAQPAGGPDLVQTVSSATRLPGQYAVTWDGKDDRGRVVEQGTYRVSVEAAREHGSYELLRQELTVGTRPVSMSLPGNDELQGVKLAYRLKK